MSADRELDRLGKQLADNKALQYQALTELQAHVSTMGVDSMSDLNAELEVLLHQYSNHLRLTRSSESKMKTYLGDKAFNEYIAHQTK